MRRFPLYFLASVLFFIPFVPQAAYFPDVRTEHPNYTAIEALTAEGFIEGYDDGTFQPSSPVTRAELAAMIVRALKVNPEAGRYKNCFDDTTRQWFAPYVCFGKSSLWLSGYPGTQLFRPGSNVIVVESLRMVIDAFHVQRLAATEFLKRKWDVPFGYKNMGRGTMLPAQWYEDYLVTAREFKFLDVSPFHAAKMMNRAELAELIYRVLWYKGFDFSRAPIPPPIGATIEPGGLSIEMPNQGTRTACSLPIQKPVHQPGFTPPSFCALDLSQTDAAQLWLGQANLPVVWGEPYDFKINSSSWAMALAYASELFNINPNYLLSIGLKESRLDCSVNSDGCFQITQAGFSELKAQYPQYIDFSAGQSLVQKFEPAVVLAALYLRFTETLYEQWYQFRNFYGMANDEEARELVMSRAYNLGVWDLGIKSALTTNRTACQRTADFFGNCFGENETAKDHAQAIRDYCQRLSRSSDLYDAALSRNDIQQFIQQTLMPTYAVSAQVNWQNIGSRADAIFSCLADKDDTISFRYDFRTFIRELKKVLPAVQMAQNANYPAP